MALIKNSKGRKEGSGYQRLLGNDDLGFLLSRIQATIISSGTELESLVIRLSNNVVDIDSFLASSPIAYGTYLLSKSAIKNSKYRINLEPDLLVLKVDKKEQHCYIIELKDGDSFDTKKAAGEKTLMQAFENHISKQIRFTTSIHFCCFNQEDKSKIVSGFKNKISLEMAMTGTELCSILGINYNDILLVRQEHQIENINFFIDELMKIDLVRALILEKLSPDYKLI